MKHISGGITSPKGFTASGVFCGIKKKNLDLAVLFSKTPAQAAGAFTRNIVRAAPVEWDQNIISKGKPVHAVVINSGNANACTGTRGMEDTRKMAGLLSGEASIEPEQVLVCSTGVIGVPMPMDNVSSGIHQAYRELDNTPEAASRAARAILTTDTFTKETAVEIDVDGIPVRIAGIAKGSGMIHPDMATMLSFILTDARLEEGLLQDLIGQTILDSYNMISVDGDTSTNDTVLALANGCSDSPVISIDSPWYETFRQAFDYVNAYLARQIVLDGEGATKFIEASVTGAASKKDARMIAKSVITSNLVKAAFFGEDANWGRILCAMGYSGGSFDPAGAMLQIESPAGSILLLKEGSPVPFDEGEALTVLKQKELTIKITLNEGAASAAAWGCDLSYEYVRINGEYRS